MSYSLLGYTSSLVARADESVSLHLSRESGPESYTAELVRIVCGDNLPGGAGFKEQLVSDVTPAKLSVRKQPLFTGSFGLIAPPADAFDFEQGFSVTCRFFATTVAKGGRQGLISRQDMDTGRGWSLGIDDAGRLEARIDDKVLHIAHPLLARAWYQAALCYERNTRSAVLYLTPLRRSPAAHGRLQASCHVDAMEAPDAPIVIAARGSDLVKLGRGEAADHFNGKIECPAVFDRLLEPAEVDLLVTVGHADARVRGLVAAWDFSAETPSSRIIDVGPSGLHGELLNLPTRAVASSEFDSSAMAWTERPSHFAAIHFHDDDFEDARWAADLEVRLPGKLRSGIYAFRLTSDCATVVERICFIVAAPPGGTGARIAFLASTLTYLMYSNMHSATDMAETEAKRGLWMTLGPAEIFLNEHRDLGLSTYDTHSDGSGVCYSSARRPLFSMHVGGKLWALNADTHITDWLEAGDFDYDVITDDHLHQSGTAILQPYKVVVTGTHPEYWTTEMLDALETWSQTGGRLMYLGGNGFYWRTAFHPDKPWLAEVRRAESGARFWKTEPGEAYHSFTGEYGGLWSRLGRAAQRFTGVGTIAVGFDFSSYYRRRPESHDPRVSFIFDGVPDEIIGKFGLIGGGAAGSEIDSADLALGTPPHALLVASSEDHSRFTLLVPESMTSSIAYHNGEENPRVKADMVFFETPEGGAVFSVGSISWAAALCHGGYQNNVARITANVLLRFADQTPFPMPFTPEPQEAIDDRDRQ